MAYSPDHVLRKPLVLSPIVDGPSRRPPPDSRFHYEEAVCSTPSPPAQSSPVFDSHLFEQAPRKPLVLSPIVDQPRRDEPLYSPPTTSLLGRRFQEVLYGASAVPRVPLPPPQVPTPAPQVVTAALQVAAVVPPVVVPAHQTIAPPQQAAAPQTTTALAPPQAPSPAPQVASQVLQVVVAVPASRVVTPVPQATAPPQAAPQATAAPTPAQAPASTSEQTPPSDTTSAETSVDDTKSFFPPPRRDSVDSSASKDTTPATTPKEDRPVAAAYEDEVKETMELEESEEEAGNTTWETIKPDDIPATTSAPTDAVWSAPTPAARALAASAPAVLTTTTFAHVDPTPTLPAQVPTAPTATSVIRQTIVKRGFALVGGPKEVQPREKRTRDRVAHFRCLGMEEKARELEKVLDARDAFLREFKHPILVSRIKGRRSKASTSSVSSSELSGLWEDEHILSGSMIFWDMRGVDIVL